ncbi:MAG: transglutaminase-like domain-containing protein [Planctomycetaceae bacterium]|nr:transglutaminase-like domain-containing protein [Planctomycetaceae bacterium]
MAVYVSLALENDAAAILRASTGKTPGARFGASVGEEFASPVALDLASRYTARMGIAPTTTLTAARTSRSRDLGKRGAFHLSPAEYPFAKNTMSHTFLAMLRPVALALTVSVCCIADRCAGQAVEKGTHAGVAHETWNVCLLQGQRAGYDRTIVRHEKNSGREILRTEYFSRLSFNRGGQEATMDTLWKSDETPEGQLLRFEMEMRVGPTPIQVTGEVHGVKLDLQTHGPGGSAPKQSSLTWSTDCRGPSAVEQSLVRRPMQPGERRSLKVLTPVLDSVIVADVELKAAEQFEATSLRTGTHDLLRIDTVSPMPGGQKIESTLWCDRTGEIQKTVVGPAETYRATKEEALEKSEAASVDLLGSTLLKLDRPLQAGHQTKRVRYRVHLKEGDPAAAFATGPTQSVKSIDAHTAQITVIAIRPGKADGNPNAPADPPTNDDRQPNNFIQSDDPLIRADAEKAAGNEKGRWATAVALEQFVHREVVNKDFTQGFASAADVAKAREGDCTEHAVFLAALARARGIPARVAMGLVYIERLQAFGYHMWTEVYVDERWIPVDGTLALGGIGAAHLKVGQSNLKGASAISAFLPVVSLIGRLKIEVLDAE